MWCWGAPGCIAPGANYITFCWHCNRQWRSWVHSTRSMLRCARLLICMATSTRGFYLAFKNAQAPSPRGGIIYSRRSPCVLRCCVGSFRSAFIILNVSWPFSVWPFIIIIIRPIRRLIVNTFYSRWVRSYLLPPRSFYAYKFIFHLRILLCTNTAQLSIFYSTAIAYRTRVQYQ